MTLAPGTRLGVYEISAKIGEGGMGEVYRARDTELGRDVALKTLPDAFVADPDRVARFQREAQVLASLNHPGIAQIYGVEKSPWTGSGQAGPQALVLELVEGPTLADRIAHGGMPIDDVLPIATQIAEALEAAHEQGVIHRDLKPANIKVRADGTVKVLDFGLAKALAGDQAGQDLSQSPTVTASIGGTAQGVILGTAAYMSPEQARGREVDKRTDIWAFGCVLYEMLTGQAAFGGETLSDTIANVLGRELDLEALPAETPAVVRKLLRRCLTREQKDRLRDIGDARVELREAGAAPEAVAAPARPDASEKAATGRLLRVLPWVATIALGAAVGVWLGGLGESAPPPASRQAFSVALPPGVSLSPIARVIADLSPDGQHLVFRGQHEDGSQQLYHRPLDQAQARPIPGTQGGSEPFFSPDGEWVGYRDGQAVMKVRLDGSPPELIGNRPPGDYGGLAWGDDDTIWMGVWDFSGALRESGREPGLYRMPAAGGTPTLVTAPPPDGDVVGFSNPRPLPGGVGVLYHTTVGSGSDASLGLYLPDIDEHRLLARGRTPWFASTGHIVFSDHQTRRRPGVGAGGVLWALPFDLERLEPTGEPVRVRDGIFVTTENTSQAYLGRDGTLVYVAGPQPAERTLVLVDRDGTEELLGTPPGQYRAPRWSPDGGRILVQIPRGGTADISVYDRASGELTAVTTDAGIDTYPLWDVTGARVFFGSDRGRETEDWAVYAKSADGTGDAIPVFSDPARTHLPWSVSPGGQALLTQAFDHTARGDIGYVSLVDPVWTPLAEFAGSDVWPVVSPDGRWVTFNSGQTGGAANHVAPYPEGGAGVPVARGANHAVWLANDELAYRSPGQRAMMSVKLRFVDGGVQADPPVKLFDDPYFFQQVSPADFDVLPDGRFLMIKDAPFAAAGQISLVRNWVDELTERAPPTR